MKELFIICACHSMEHQLIFWYDKIDNEVGVYTHLNQRGFWRRLKYGIKYIFGYRSLYGAFDEFLFDKDGIERLQVFLNDNSK